MKTMHQPNLQGGSNVDAVKRGAVVRVWLNDFGTTGDEMGLRKTRDKFKPMSAGDGSCR